MEYGTDRQACVSWAKGGDDTSVNTVYDHHAFLTCTVKGDSKGTARTNCGFTPSLLICHTQPGSISVDETLK